jgi:hypothetical protein
MTIAKAAVQDKDAEAAVSFWMLSIDSLQPSDQLGGPLRCFGQCIQKDEVRPRS